MVVLVFRDVSGASENKEPPHQRGGGVSQRAEVALAREGNAAAAKAQAAGYAADRVDRAFGDASRFTQRESAFRKSPETTETRLYWETMGASVARKKKTDCGFHEGAPSSDYARRWSGSRRRGLESDTFRSRA